jgi:DNA-binding MarR family transcriptional regulator
MKAMIRRVQRAYPEVWFACHVGHRTRRSASGLTDREAGILEHLDASPGERASSLARHLGIGKSALSAQLKRFVELGLIEREVAEDARERRVRLTTRARTLLLQSLPLSAERVGRLLVALDAAERQHAVLGLELLARAARLVHAKGDRP